MQLFSIFTVQSFFASLKNLSLYPSYDVPFIFVEIKLQKLFKIYNSDNSVIFCLLVYENSRVFTQTRFAF